MPSSTAIQPIVFGRADITLQVAEQLQSRGYWVGAIRPPTVPQNTSRLRITLSAAHSAEQVSGLLDALASAVGAVGGLSD